MSRSRLLFVLLAVLTLGCDDDQAGPVFRPPKAALLLPVSPERDSSFIGEVVPLMVRAVTRDTQAVAGTPVTWQASTDGDSLLSAESATDANGFSRATVRLGTRAGDHGFSATSPGLATREFFIFARSAPFVRLDLQPRALTLVPRQTALILALPYDSLGNISQARLRWKSSDELVATVDTSGVVRARQVGTATIYVNAADPPFMVDSVQIRVVPPVAATILLTPDTAGFVVGTSLRLSARAFDVLGIPIDAKSISWTTSNWQLPIQRVEQGGDTSYATVTAKVVTTADIVATVGGVSFRTRINTVADPVVDSLPVRNDSGRYGGITFGPSGRWYYVVHTPQDSSALRTNDPAAAGWTQSATFAGCWWYGPVCSISIDQDENIYVPTLSGVRSINGHNGTLRWLAPIGDVRGNIAISSKNHIVFASTRDTLNALDAATGKLLWQFSPMRYAWVQAAVDEERGVVYSVGPNVVAALEQRSGTILWMFTTLSIGGVQAPPALARDGTIYIASSGDVMAITPTGHVRANYGIDGGGVYGSPLIDAAGNVYVVTHWRSVYSFTPDLALRWKYVIPFDKDPVNARVEASPVIAADGTVYIGTDYDAQYGLVAIRDGRLLWTRPGMSAGSEHFSILPNGELWAPTGAGLYRIRTAGFDTNAQWPMAHRTLDRAANR